MNIQESLALLARGKEAWNAWAQDMLARRQALEDQGQFRVRNLCEPLNQETSDWQQEAEVNFFRHIFTELVDFSGLIFPGRANFLYALFLVPVCFHSVRFYGSADFRWSRFQESLTFRRCVFSGTADFSRARIVRSLHVGATDLHARASFRWADTGDASFTGSTFHALADFNDNGGRSLSFRNCSFGDDLLASEKDRAEARSLSPQNQQECSDFRGSCLQKVALENCRIAKGLRIAFLTVQDLALRGCFLGKQAKFGTFRVNREFVLSDCYFPNGLCFECVDSRSAPELAGSRFSGLVEMERNTVRSRIAPRKQHKKAWQSLQRRANLAEKVRIWRKPLQIPANRAVRTAAKNANPMNRFKAGIRYEWI